MRFMLKNETILPQTFRLQTKSLTFHAGCQRRKRINLKSGYIVAVQQTFHQGCADPGKRLQYGDISPLRVR